MPAPPTWLFENWPLVLIGTLLLGRYGDRLTRTMRRPRRWRTYRRPWSRSLPRAPLPRSVSEPFDAAAQLRHVERASFTPRPLLNQSEARLFAALERICAEEKLDWRVMAQVSLGEILASPNPDAYRAINSKRIDLLLVNAAGYAVHAIEYQGSGHHLGPAATRDAIKREALRKAGINYVEIVPGDTPAELRRLLLRLSVRAIAPPESPSA